MSVRLLPPEIDSIKTMDGNPQTIVSERVKKKTKITDIYFQTCYLSCIKIWFWKIIENKIFTCCLQLNFLKILKKIFLIKRIDF